MLIKVVHSHKLSTCTKASFGSSLRIDPSLRQLLPSRCRPSFSQFCHPAVWILRRRFYTVSAFLSFTYCDFRYAIAFHLHLSEKSKLCCPPCFDFCHYYRTIDSTRKLLFLSRASCNLLVGWWLLERMLNFMVISYSTF